MREWWGGRGEREREKAVRLGGGEMRQYWENMESESNRRGGGIIDELRSRVEI